MKRLPLLLLIAAALCLPSCKSHKQATVRQSPVNERPAARKSSAVPKHSDSDPAFSNDRRVADALVKSARQWIGTPYRYGGESRKGTDCSGMTMAIFRDVADIKLPRNSAAQCEYCFDIPKGKLEPGDLVFFTSSKGSSKITHVGLYVGSGKMIHASTSRGVITSALDEKYYLNHYHSSGRVYGITYAAKGTKAPKDNKTPKDKKAPKGDNAPKGNKTKPASSSATPSGSGTVEMTLDEFINMQSTTPQAPADTIAAPPVASPAPTDTVAPKPAPVPVKPQTTDSVPADSTRQAADIRNDVTRAMRFGK